MRLLFLIVLVITFASSVIWMAERAHRAPDSDSILMIDQLTRLDGNTPPNQLVQPLPHFWRDDPLPQHTAITPGEHRNGRREWIYQTNLDLAELDYQLWGLYLPDVMHDAEIILNGNQLGEPLTPPHYSRRGLTSLYYAIPGRVITKGDNQLVVRVTAQPASRGYLGKLYIGPADELRALHDGRVQQNQLLWFSAIMLLLLAMTGLVLARDATHDQTYGWFSALCVIWVVMQGTGLLTQSWVDWKWIEVISVVGRAMLTCSAYMFCLSYIHGATPTRTWVIAIAGLVTLVLNVSDAFVPFDSALPILSSRAVLLSIGFYVGGVFIYHAIRQRDDDVLVLSVGGVLVLGFGIHDTLIRFSSEAPGIYYLGYLSPVLFLVAGYVLLRRFSRALKEAQQEYTAQGVLQPSAQSDQISTSGTRHLLIAERERIMRDMHDGVGGHLVSSLSILRTHNIANPDLEETLNQALVDLRLMIDSLEDTEGDLSVAVAMLKERTQRTLRGSALAAHWTIDEIMLPGRGPADTLQILRILQETISNVLKHSQASELHVLAGMQNSETACFVVSDNGKGFDSQTVSIGRGLLNITRRAETLNATIEIESSPTTGGTKVTLLVPDRMDASEPQGFSPGESQ